MVAVLGGEILRDFLVTLQALISGNAGAELMAGIALRGSIQGRVSLGQRAGRDLRFGRQGKRQENAEEQKRGKRGASGEMAQRIDG